MQHPLPLYDRPTRKDYSSLSDVHLKKGIFCSNIYLVLTKDITVKKNVFFIRNVI